MSSSMLHVGCASGFSGDRTDGAVPVVESLISRGGGALVYETLAERTLALAQLARNADPDAGYEPLLNELLTPVLGDCLNHHIRIISNFGAANPQGAARRIHALARELGLRPPKVAVITGDSLGTPEQLDYLRAALGSQARTLDIVSINAYQGAMEMAEALRAGAEIVVAGRVADPSLVLAPALAQFNWASDDWNRLGAATMAGHLLECGTQVTGGYFAIPGLKDVPGMASLGFPIASIAADGHFSITKPVGTGGCVTERTVKEQLLYEVHNPAAYLTPDVTADISQAHVRQLEPDVVGVSHILGHRRPDMLKVNICHSGGWLAEAEISYAGVQAEARARLAAEVVQQRLAGVMPLRADLIGVISLFGDDAGRALADTPCGTARDVRLRLAGSHPERSVAERVLREVTALYCCGPAGGGGVRTSLRPRLGTVSAMIPRELAPAAWQFVEPAKE